jgi:hypothetical protein
MEYYFRNIFLSTLISAQIWGTSVNGKKNSEAFEPEQLWHTVTGRINEIICKLRACLKEKGLEENKIFIFMNDNGTVDVVRLESQRFNGMPAFYGYEINKQLIKR